MQRPESDLELVRHMLAGDETAFDRFFDAAYPALYRFALARLHGDGDAAQEIAQVTICKAIGKLHTFRGEAALLTWLCTFCRHELYAWGQRQNKRVHVELVEDDPEIRAALESLQAMVDVESPLDRTAMASVVRLVLDRLPSHYARALEWKYIDEISVGEIASRLDMGAKAAESLLTRARAAFRDAFRALAPAWLELDS